MERGICPIAVLYFGVVL